MYYIRVLRSGINESGVQLAQCYLPEGDYNFEDACDYARDELDYWLRRCQEWELAYLTVRLYAMEDETSQYPLWELTATIPQAFCPLSSNAVAGPCALSPAGLRVSIVQPLVAEMQSRSRQMEERLYVQRDLLQVYEWRLARARGTRLRLQQQRQPSVLFRQ